MESSQVHFTNIYKHSTPSATPVMHTQLAFNQNKNCYSQYPIITKPRPIVIEKLMPPKNIATDVSEKIEQDCIETDNERILSSQRLAMAVQLAKIDMKKLKCMLGNTDIDTEKDDAVPPNKKSTTLKKAGKASLRPITNKSTQKEDKLRNNEIQNRNFQHSSHKGDTPAFGKNEVELETLRKRMIHFIQRLLDFIKKINRVGFQSNLQVSNNEEHLKKLQKSEEQKTRLSHVLYNLQHKVYLLDKYPPWKRKKRNSGYIESVVSAHRTAIRTLQTFLHQAQLFIDTSNELPPTYKELAQLLQRLVKLVGDVQPDSSDLVLQQLLEEIERFEKLSNKPHQCNDDKARLLDEFFEKKPQELGMKRLNKAAIKQLSSVMKLDQPVKKEIKDKKKSVLIPKNKLTTKKFKNVNSNFSAPTVLSRIREKARIEKSPKPKVENKRPKNVSQNVKDDELIRLARSHTLKNSKKTSDLKPSDRFSPNSSIVSHLSYYNSPPLSPTHVNKSNGFPFVQKEIERQRWLDSYKEKEFRRLEKMNKQTSREFEKLKRDYVESNDLIYNAEMVIREKLKPLISRAEEVALADAKRSAEYAHSVKMRLADVASSKAISEGERLAEYILDDIVQEVAVELQGLEVEEEADEQAAYVKDRPTLERINERIKELELQESEMRRYYQSIAYDSFNHSIVPANPIQASERNEYNSLVKKRWAGHEAYYAFTSLPEKKLEIPSRVPVNRESGQNINVAMPTALVNNVLLFKERYENYMQGVGSYGINAYELSEELFEELLDEMLTSVSEELHDICDYCIDSLYEQEFLT